MRAMWGQPAELLEKEWQAQVVQLAKQLGWCTYHTFNSRRSAYGFPDLVLVRDRVVFIELKREDRTTSRLTDDQRGWLRRLDDAGAEWYVARPSHLDELVKVLGTWRGREPLETVAPNLLRERYDALGGGAKSNT